MNGNGSGLKAWAAEIWSRARPAFLRVAKLVGLYLDDLLMVGAGVCFVTAADALGGKPWALLTGGICLLGYAIVVARARGRGGRK